MSLKLLKLQKLIEEIRSMSGFKVNAQVRQPQTGFYQVFVVVSKDGREVVNYVSSNVDDALAAIKGFIGLMA